MPTLLAWLLLAAGPPARAADDGAPAEPELPEYERDALALVDVMPIIETLAQRPEIRAASDEALGRAAAARMLIAFPDPLLAVVDHPDRLIDLFYAIAALRELHRRGGGLPGPLRAVEAQAAIALQQLGVQAQTDPLFDRRLRTWRDRATTDEDRAALQAALISMQAAREIGDRWFPEAVTLARDERPDDETLTAQIGLWMIGYGDAKTGVSFLQALRTYGRSADRFRAYYLGLRAARRDAALAELSAELRGGAPETYRPIAALEARDADRVADLAFRVAPRPRAAADLVAHARRAARDPAAAPADVHAAIALALTEGGVDEAVLRGLSDLALAGAVTPQLVDALAAAGARGGAAAEFEVARWTLILRAAAAELGALAAAPPPPPGAEGPTRSDVAARAVVASIAALNAVDGSVELAPSPEHVDAVRLAILTDAIARGATPDVRQVRRQAKRLGRRGVADPALRRVAAAALALVGDAKGAAAALTRAPSRVDAGALAELRVDAAHVWLAVGPDGGPRDPGRARREIARAAADGLAPGQIALHRLLVEVVAAGSGADRAGPFVPDAWLDLAATADRRLGTDADARADAARVGILRHALGDRLVPAGAWALAPAHPHRPLHDASAWLVAGEPARAVRALGPAPEAGDPRFAWAHHRLRYAACADLRDAACVSDASAALGRLWGPAGIPELAPAGFLLFVPEGAAGAGVRLPDGGPLGAEGALRSWPLPIRMPPHTRDALVGGAGR